MSDGKTMDTTSLKAIDVHVHIEHTGEAAIADKAAEKYFGSSGAPRERNALAEYYRSRNMACVVFTVDERLTGRPMVPNDEIIQFAHDNADIAIPFEVASAVAAVFSQRPDGLSAL